MPTRMQQRGGGSLKRPSLFANAGRQATTAPSKKVQTRASLGANRQHPLAGRGASSYGGNFKALVPPVPGGVQSGVNDVSFPESTLNGGKGEANNKLADRVATLAERGKKQKIEIDRQKIVINGLQRNLELMTATNKQDKQRIEELNSQIFQLKSKKGQTNELLYSPGSAKSLEQKHTIEIERLKAQFYNDYGALERKYDMALNELKEAQQLNKGCNDRIQIFEKDLLSKSSSEVTYKKQMETVSAHAKRMVDENRKLKEKLKASTCAENKIKELEFKVKEATDEIKSNKEEIEKLKFHSNEKTLKLEQYESDLATLRVSKESEIQRRKKAIKDLSAKTAKLSQLNKEHDSCKDLVKKLKHELGHIELRKKVEYDALLNEKDEIQNDLDCTVQERNSLRVEIEKLKKDYILTKKSITGLNEEVPKLRQRLRESQKECENMSTDRDLLSHQLQEMKGQHKKTLLAFEKEKAILVDENKSLRAKNEALESSSSLSINEYEEKVKKLEQYIDELKQETSRGIKNAQIQVDNIQKQCDLLSHKLSVQTDLTSSETSRAETALKKLNSVEADRVAEGKQIAFLERQLEDQRSSSANESRRAESALSEAARCRDRYNDEHSRAQTLTSELSELRHAHLKLSEKVQKLQLQSGAKSDMHTRIEKERDMAQAALNELKNAMREQGVLYEKCQTESKEKDFLFQSIQNELHTLQKKHNELMKDVSDAQENARLAKLLKATELELRNTLAKILKAEEATESAYTCLICMNIFDKPITCIPCGHSFCEKCVNGYRSKNANKEKDGECCPECDENGKTSKKKVDYFIQNELLENLSSRFLFRKQAIESLSLMVGKLK